MKRKIIVGACFFLLMSIVLMMLTISPYNPIHYFNAENKIKSLLVDPAIREEGLGENSEIINVKYLGNDLYRVETEESMYLIEINEKKSSRDITIYEYKQRITFIQGYKG